MERHRPRHFKARQVYQALSVLTLVALMSCATMDDGMPQWTCEAPEGPAGSSPLAEGPDFAVYIQGDPYGEGRTTVGVRGDRRAVMAFRTSGRPGLNQRYSTRLTEEDFDGFLEVLQAQDPREIPDGTYSGSPTFRVTLCTAGELTHHLIAEEPGTEALQQEFRRIARTLSAH